MTRLFTTIPPSTAYGQDYAQYVRRVVDWGSAAGVEGALIYTDNSLVDPWAVAQLVLERTRMFTPLIATQPIYMPPFTAAKRIASYAQLYGGKVALNMVAGGFKKDLNAFGDDTPHDERYARLEEYSEIIMALLHGETVTIEGSYHHMEGVRLLPDVDASLLPEIFLSGSSDAGRETAMRLGATAVSYPPTPEEIKKRVAPGSFARVGIIARDTAEDAWTLAHARFPQDRRGRLAHRMATASSDSVWVKQLADLGEKLESAPQGLYWLHPLQTYKTFCPYLVGSHAEVAQVIADYAGIGFDGFILDVPATQEDLPNTVEVFRQAGLSVGYKSLQMAFG